MGGGGGACQRKVREAVERKRLKRDRKKEVFFFFCSGAVKSPRHLLSSIRAKQCGGVGRLRGGGWPPVFGLHTHTHTRTSQVPDRM